MKRPFEYASNVDTDNVNNAVMLEVECSKVGGNFCSDMGVSGFPTVMLVHNGKGMKYQGGRTHGAIVQFLGDTSQWVMEDLPPKIAKIAKALDVSASSPPQIVPTPDAVGEASVEDDGMEEMEDKHAVKPLPVAIVDDKHEEL